MVTSLILAMVLQTECKFVPQSPRRYVLNTYLDNSNIKHNILDTMRPEYTEFKTSPKPKITTDAVNFLEGLRPGALIVVTNVQNADLLESRLPIVIRYPQPMFTRSRYGLRSSLLFEWIPKSHLCNDSCKLENISCPVSKHITKINLVSFNSGVGHCSVLNFYNYSSSSKPWIGLIEVALFVPNYLLQIQTLGFRAFQYEGEKENFANLITSSALPTVNVLVSSTNQPNHPDHHLFKWISSTMSRSYAYSPRIVHDIFLHLMVNNSITAAIRKICKCASYITSYQLPLNAFHLLDNTGIYAIAYPEVSWKWSQVSCDMNYVNSEINKRARHCRQNKLKCDNSYTRKWDETNALLVTEVFSFLLLALFNNQTMNFLTACKTGTSVDNRKNQLDVDREKLENIQLQGNIPWVTIVSGRADRPVDKSSLTENVLKLQYVFDIQRFVTCGKRGTDPYKFYEFVNVYDKLVWAVFIASLLFLSTALFLSQSNCTFKGKSGFRLIEKIVGSSMPVLKAVFEQGDPFAAYYIKTTRLRWIVSGYLFAALVLSNGYKNTNVYNMITARKPVLVETLDDVISQNFSLYVRTKRLDLNPLHDQTWFARKEENYQKPFIVRTTRVAREWFFERHGKRNRNGIKNEIYSGDWFGRQFLHGAVYGESGVVDTYKSKLDRLSKLNNVSAQTFGLLLSTIVPLIQAKFFRSKQELQNIVNELKVWFYYKELNGFLQELVACKRSAFLLPEDLCHKFAIIASVRNGDVVAVSKDQFYNKSYWIEIKHHFDPLYIRKISYIKQSGVPKWLPTVVKSTNTYISDKNEAPQSATLQGNVTMIFIIMYVGHVLATTSFLAERSKSCWIYYVQKFRKKQRKKRPKQILIRIKYNCIQIISARGSMK